MMTRWDAYYYDGLDAVSAPSRTLTIEAESEDEAGKIAVAGMGRSMRVHVTQKLWGNPRPPILSDATHSLASDSKAAAGS